MRKLTDSHLPFLKSADAKTNRFASAVFAVLLFYEHWRLWIIVRHQDRLEERSLRSFRSLRSYHRRCSRNYHRTCCRRRCCHRSYRRRSCCHRSYSLNCCRRNCFLWILPFRNHYHWNQPPELLPPELFPELLPPELFPLDPPFPESLSLESSLSEESSSFSSVSSSLGAT